MRSPSTRRELGAFYTPPDVADRLVERALPRGTPSVCDPACGDGAFLLAAGRELERRGVARTTIAQQLLWGIDVDAEAVAAARAAITEWAGVSPDGHVIVADGLTHTDWVGRFDAVVGNPPFLNQLEQATVRRVPHRWEGVVGPYADTAFLFLLAALDLVGPGGRIALIQPQSLVASRDARAVRDTVQQRAALVGMWTCDEAVFDASVRVCAPILSAGSRSARTVRRWTGRAFASAPPARIGAETWSGALSRDVPTVALDSSRTLGELATATAGFRQQFYGLAPHVVDVEDSDLPQLVTCGVLDPGRCAWGEREVRFSGRRWRHPRVDVEHIDSDAVRRWVHERLVPKVVLATQTRVLEAAVDVNGVWVPSTPVIAVHTAHAQLFAVAAVLTAPPVSAWAAATYAGVALAADAIKLSARQVLEIPLPRDQPRWDAAAEALRHGDLLDAGAHMTAAYRAGDAVLEWWRSRLPNQ